MLVVLIGVLGGASGIGAGLSDRFGCVHASPDFCVELGVGWTRFDFTWAGVEREKGVFDFTQLHQHVAEARAKGVQILPILDYGPAWDPERSPDDEETLDLWARYVERTVREFKDYLKYWQVWNEPNLPMFWRPKPDARAYAELLRRSYRAIKGVDPELQVIGFNCSDIDLEFVEKVVRYGGLRYCDILAFQPYRIAPELGQYEEMEAVRAILARHGQEKPIWFTEMGWASEHFPFSDAADLMAERPARRQAAYLVRYMSQILATGVAKVFWFEQSAGSHGLIDYRTGEKRPSFYAYKHFIETVGDCMEVRELTPHGARDRYAYLFVCPERYVVVAWSTTGEQTLDLPGCRDAIGARDMLGNSIDVSNLNFEKGDRFRISREPVYLLFDSLPESLAVLASLRVSPSRLYVEPGQLAQVRVEWEPLPGAPDGIAFKIAGPEKTRWALPRVEFAHRGERTASVAVRRGATPVCGLIEFVAGELKWTAELNITPRRLWAYQAEGKGYLDSAVLPLRRGGDAILFGAFDTPEVLCLSSAGERLWSYRDRQPIYGTPQVGNICGDVADEIVCAMPGLQTLFALDNDGILLWRARLEGDAPNEQPQYDWTEPRLADLDEDGLREILYADPTGFVTCLDGEGNIRWRTRVSEARCDVPVHVAYGPDSGSAVILVADRENSLHGVSTQGEALWSADVGAPITAPPLALGPRDGIPGIVYVATKREELVGVSIQGEVVSRLALGGTVDHGAGLNYFSDRADAKFALSTRNDEVMTFDWKGKVLARRLASAQLRSKPASGLVAAIGGHGILFTSVDGVLRACNERMEVQWAYRCGNRLDAAPGLVDLTGDDLDDIVLPVRGGRILALTLAAK